MKYQVEYTPQAVEDLKDLSPTVRSLLYGWIEKNLVDCENPRRHGSGDSEGGRWRYQIGEYRILAQIQDNKIVILTVLAGLRRTANQKNSGAGKPSMPPNVFLRSTLRQPVRTLCLLLVVVLVTFAFVGRGSEYLLIRQETGRLESYYRAIGSLKPDPGEINQRGLDILQKSSSVKMAEQIRYGSAVMEGLYNVDSTEENGARFLRDDVFFYGTLVQKLQSSTYVMSTGTQQPAYYFYFEVDTVIAGYPEAIEPGDTVRLTNPNELLYWGLPYTLYMDLTEVYEELEVGGRYLLRGDYNCSDPMCSIKALDGKSSFQLQRLGGTKGLLYYPVEPGQEADFSDPRLAGVAEQIRIVDDNQHSLSTVTSQDVSALAEVWKDIVYLVDGRWPDGTDNTDGKRVCAIPEALASYNGLAVGDTLTLTLRDLKNPYRDGYLYDDVAIADEIETSPQEEYEIVGIVGRKAYETNFVFLPASALLETFQYGNTYGKNPFDEVIFELNSPADEKQFREETAEALSAFGFKAEIIETGWDNFQNAAGPMRQSSLFSAAVFTGVLLAALSLAAFLYYRMRRGDFAKARALGLPAKICGRQVTLPLLLIGAAGTLTGSVLGWQFTQSKAVETLRSLAEFGKLSDGLSGGWLLALWTVSFALLAVLAAGGAVLLAQRPVLNLLQGDMMQQAAKTSKTYVTEAPAIQTAELDLSPLGQVIGSTPVSKGGTGTSHVLHFVWRHIWRSPVKTALAAVLAAGFVVGLAVVRLSIAESRERIEEFYNSTVVSLELVAETPPRSISNNGFINAKAVGAIQSTGFIQDAYLEGSNEATVIPYDGTWVRGTAVSVRDKEITNVQARSFDNLDEFLEKTSSRTKVTVIFFDGWDETLFALDWAALDAETSDEDPVLFPVILPEEICEEYSLQPGDTVGISCGSFRLCEAAGFYTGGGSSAILLPNSAAEAMTGDRMHYSAASFELDPSRNQELDQFRTELDSILEAAQGNGVTLRALLGDDELKQAVEPLEDNVVLMELLYPVVIVLSLLVAVGLAVLFVMTSAKEAAIMRVLDTSRLRSGMMLALQTAFTSIAGLLIGLAGILLYTGRTRPESLVRLLGASVLCAALYLLAAILGSAASASILTGRNPLELLQVKE